MNGKVGRGAYMPGLITYLFGPGDANEHTNPHLIATSDGVDPILTPWRLGYALESTVRLFGTAVAGGHVWHCSLSAPPGERLSDAQWAESARMLIAGMGWDETRERAQLPWVAVHHGLSLGGNDHIHVAVCLVSEDGTAADVFRDYPRVSAVCAAIERRFGLFVVEGRAGRGMPGLTRAEIEVARRRGRPEPDRTVLARQVRAASVAARDEAEFARRLRDAGVLVRAREGLGEEVVGFAVALAPRPGDEPIWYGGARLAPDLSLPRLRAHWDGVPADAAQWRGEAESPTEAREKRVRDAGAWERATARIEAATEALRAVPIGDHAAWSGAAREAAGVFAAWSVRLETERPGPLAQAADVLARSAQTGRGEPRALRTASVRDLRGVAMIAGQAVLSASGQARMLRQMRQLMRALRDAEHARGRAVAAARLTDSGRVRLSALQREFAVAGAAGEPRLPRRGSIPTRPTSVRGRDDPGDRQR